MVQGSAVHSEYKYKKKYFVYKVFPMIPKKLMKKTQKQSPKGVFNTNLFLKHAIIYAEE